MCVGGHVCVEGYMYMYRCVHVGIAYTCCMGQHVCICECVRRGVCVCVCVCVRERERAGEASFDKQIHVHVHGQYCLNCVWSSLH